MNASVLASDRGNVGRRLFDLFNPQPHPRPTIFAQSESLGTRKGAAAAASTKAPRSNTQLSSRPENQQQQQKAPIYPPVPTTSHRRRERGSPDAPEEDPTVEEEQATTGRITKVQLVEQESLQITEQLTRQAAMIEQLSKQVNQGAHIRCAILTSPSASQERHDLESDS